MSDKTKQDELYSRPLEAITDFVFDESVVQIFRDMIGRSVPGYSTLLSMLPVLARKYAQDDSTCFDLGCSLGASTLALRHGISAKNVNIMAVDNSAAMIDRCRAYIEKDSSDVPVTLKCSDIRDIDIQQASIVVMNFTLQFIDVKERQNLVKKIYQGLKPGGIFVLSEKVIFNDVIEQQWMDDLHHEFKKTNNYSELEISQKRTALENVLIPESVSEHLKRLEDSEFNQSMVWFQCFNFVSFLAIK